MLSPKHRALLFTLSDDELKEAGLFRVESVKPIPENTSLLVFKFSSMVPVSALRDFADVYQEFRRGEAESGHHLPQAIFLFHDIEVEDLDEELMAKAGWVPAHGAEARVQAPEDKEAVVRTAGGKCALSENDVMALIAVGGFVLEALLHFGGQASFGDIHHYVEVDLGKSRPGPSDMNYLVNNGWVEPDTDFSHHEFQPKLTPNGEEIAKGFVALYHRDE